MNEEAGLRTSTRQSGSDDGVREVKKPFLFDYYNVDSCTMGDHNGIKSCIARIQNCVSYLLEQASTLPRMIVIIPDNDVVKCYLNDLYEFGAAKIAEELVAWLVHEIDKSVLGRKDEIKKQRKGAVMRGEPKMVYIKMMYRPGCDSIQALRNHFNVALENRLAKVHNHYVIDAAVQYTGFDLTNFLTANGKTEYWQNLDKTLGEFDDKPSRFTPQSKQQVKNKPKNNGQQYKLPSPTPKPRK